MKVKIKNKENISIYKSGDKSLLHSFLKEEGFNRRFLALDLNIALPTVDTYLLNPKLFRVEHINAICKETDVDANFIFALIYDN
jgi:hypothetical protein